MIKEIVEKPRSFSDSENRIAELMTKSGAFAFGSEPYIGRLRKSYGYGKKIGVKSKINPNIRTRLDYDEEKGVHYNFENLDTKEKICIPINDMDYEAYKKFIDNWNIGFQGYTNNTYSVMPSDKKEFKDAVDMFLSIDNSKLYKLPNKYVDIFNSSLYLKWKERMLSIVNGYQVSQILFGLNSILGNNKKYKLNLRKGFKRISDNNFITLRKIENDIVKIHGSKYDKIIDNIEEIIFYPENEITLYKDIRMPKIYYGGNRSKKR